MTVSNLLNNLKIVGKEERKKKKSNKIILTAY